MKTFFVLFVCLFIFSKTALADQKLFRITMLGDSLTSGHGLEDQRDYFPSQLEARLRANGLHVSIQNAGISGDTVSKGLARLPPLLDAKPDLLIVALGGNDLLRKNDIKGVEKDLRAIITEARTRNIPVMLFGKKAPYAMGPFYVWSFNGLFEDVAEDFDIGFSPNFTGGVIGETGMSQPDIIHPNRKGVQKMVDNVYTDVSNYILKIKK